MTPEELEKLPKPLERTMTALELSVMSEIIQRIREAAQITPVTDWLLIRMDAIGKSRKEIKRLLRDGVGSAGLEIDQIYDQAIQSDYIRNKEIYEAAGQDYVPYGDNQWLQQVAETVREQTKDTLRPMENITKTTGFNVHMGGRKVFTPLSEYLERSLDKAMLGITTGTRTYSQAVGEVIDEMTASGIRTVDYASGKSDRSSRPPCSYDRNRPDDGQSKRKERKRTGDRLLGSGLAHGGQKHRNRISESSELAGKGLFF